ncbi:MAG: hypothetical protein ACM3ZU_11375 [Bacteroidota bacterium]
MGVEVQVGDLPFLCDYIGSRHESAQWDGDVHQLELMFSCTLPDGQVPQNGMPPDAHQVSVEWLDLAELDDYRLCPQALKRYLRLPYHKHAICMGEVN